MYSGHNYGHKTSTLEKKHESCNAKENWTTISWYDGLVIFGKFWNFGNTEKAQNFWICKI